MAQFDPRKSLKALNAKKAPIDKTRLVSMNTDGLFMQIAQGDEDRVISVVEDWCKELGFNMEWFDIVGHRQLNVNNYIQLQGDDEGNVEIKGKGSMNPDPGLGADHNKLIVNKAVAAHMTGLDTPEDVVYEAAKARRIFDFTQMLSAPRAHIEYGGRYIGKLCRIYKSNRPESELPVISIPAAGDAPASVRSPGFAVHEGDADNWPDDLDVDWYVAEVYRLLEETGTPYNPAMNDMVAELEAHGLKLVGVGGSPGISTKPKRRDNWAGTKGIEVRVGGQANLVFLPAAEGVEYPDRSRLVKCSHGELHRREHLDWSAKEIKACGGIVTGKALLHLPEQDAYIEEIADVEPALAPVPTSALAPVTDTEFVIPDEVVELSNEEYLKVVFGEHTPWVASLRSMDGDFTGGPFTGPLDPANNNFFCISRIKEGMDRRLNNVEALHVVVLDDIGTKVGQLPTQHGWGAPTAIVETSEGNTQWHYVLDEPLSAEAGNLQELMMQIILAAPSDDGMHSVHRIARLPVGTNTKKDYLPKTYPAITRLWEPQRRFSIDQICAWAGVDGAAALEVVQRSRTAPARPGEADDHPVLKAFEEADLLISDVPNRRGWYNVHCPWEEEHSTAHYQKKDDTGLLIDEDGGWVFHCQHGSCKDRMEEIPDSQGGEPHTRRARGAWGVKRKLEEVLGHHVPDPRAMVLRNSEVADRFFDQGGGISGLTGTAAPSIPGQKAGSSLPEKLDVEEMERRFVYVVKGMRVVDLSNSNFIMNVAEARSRCLSSVTEVKTKTKPKIVYNFDTWLRSENRVTVDDQTFAPGEPEITLSPNGLVSFNTFCPLDMSPVAGAEAAFKPFEDHVRWLFKEQADTFLDWCAHIVQKPGELPHTAWLHIAHNTGLGRNWIADALGRALGEYVASNLSLIGLLRDGWTSRLSRRLLAVVDEIKSTDTRNNARYMDSERLKEMVTAKFRECNQKYGGMWEERNVCRWLLFSNHLNAVPIDEQDRRFNIVHCSDQPKSDAYYHGLYSLLETEGFGAKLLWALACRDLSNFKPGARAVLSNDKATVLSLEQSEESVAASWIKRNWPAELIPTHWVKAMFDHCGGKRGGFNLPDEKQSRRRKAILAEAGITLPRNVRLRIEGKQATWYHLGNDTKIGLVESHQSVRRVNRKLKQAIEGVLGPEPTVDDFLRWYDANRFNESITKYE